MGLFTYLNRINDVKLENNHQIMEDIPSRISRVTEQLSYLNKTISSKCGIDKTELEKEVDHQYLLEHFDDFRYRNCLGMARSLDVNKGVTLVNYSNRDFKLSMHH